MKKIISSFLLSFIFVSCSVAYSVSDDVQDLKYLSAMERIGVGPYVYNSFLFPVFNNFKNDSTAFQEFNDINYPDVKNVRVLYDPDKPNSGFMVSDCRYDNESNVNLWKSTPFVIRPTESYKEKKVEINFFLKNPIFQYYDGLTISEGSAPLYGPLIFPFESSNTNDIYQSSFFRYFSSDFDSVAFVENPDSATAESNSCGDLYQITFKDTFTVSSALTTVNSEKVRITRSSFVVNRMDGTQYQYTRKLDKLVDFYYADPLVELNFSSLAPVDPTQYSCLSHYLSGDKQYYILSKKDDTHFSTLYATMGSETQIASPEGTFYSLNFGLFSEKEIGTNPDVLKYVNNINKGSSFAIDSISGECRIFLPGEEKVEIHLNFFTAETNIVRTGAPGSIVDVIPDHDPTDEYGSVWVYRSVSAEGKILYIFERKINGTTEYQKKLMESNMIVYDGYSVDSETKMPYIFCSVSNYKQLDRIDQGTVRVGISRISVDSLFSSPIFSDN